jgi:hypothetical protein
MHNAEQMRESASSGEGPTSTAQMGDHANRIEASKRAVAEARRQARRNLEVQARRATDAASPVTESQSSYTPAGVIRCENNSYSDVSCP